MFTSVLKRFPLTNAVPGVISKTCKRKYCTNFIIIIHFAQLKLVRNSLDKMFQNISTYLTNFINKWTSLLQLWILSADQACILDVQLQKDVGESDHTLSIGGCRLSVWCLQTKLVLLEGRLFLTVTGRNGSQPSQYYQSEQAFLNYSTF